MPFKITPNERKQLTNHLARLDLKREAINEKIGELRNALDPLIDEYNEVQQEVRGFVEDLHSEYMSQYDNRSETWQDGDRGSATRDWLDKLEEAYQLFDLDLDVEIPEDIEFDDEVTKIIDEGLPSEPEY